MWRKFNNATKEIAKLFIDEIELIIKDAGAVLFFIAAMFIYSLLYTLGYEKETVRDLPIAVVDLDHTVTSRQFSRIADATEQLQVSFHPGSLKEAQQLFFDDKVNGVILIPENFEKDILNGLQTKVTVYCDASYFMLYKQVYAGSVNATGTFSAGIEIKRLLANKKNLKQAVDMQEPIKTEVFNLYNPSGGYGSFIMPGMIMIIMQQLLLVGIGMLGGTIREKKSFLSMNKAVISKWGNVTLVFAKASAYVFVFLFSSIFSMGVLHRWYLFPDNGHFIPVLTFLIVYLYSVSFLGIAISMLFRERIQSILFLVFISPIVVFLSGISWPVSSLPSFLFFVSRIFPCSYMIPAYLRIRLCGAGFENVHFEGIVLFLQMIIYFVLACLAYKLAIVKFVKRIGKDSLSIK